MKQREKLKSRLEAESTSPDSDEVKNLRAEIERLKAQSPTPGDKGLKQKMAKLQKSWKAKIDEAESKLASAQAKNEELLDQLASLSPTPQAGVFIHRFTVTLTAGTFYFLENGHT